MYFETSREALLTPLKMISGIVERKQTLPILANVLVRVEGSSLHLSATDSELELSYQMGIDASLDSDGATTIPALKWAEICRSLPNNSQLQINEENERVVLKAGRSRFTLSCLPAADFPESEALQSLLSFSLPQQTLKHLLSKTQFAMAQQDVRYYLNGLLFDLNRHSLHLVATDGHRLSLARHDWEIELEEPLQVIVPRKAVLELSKILEDSEEPVQVTLGKSHIRFELPNLSLSSKLVDGNYPDYTGVIPGMAELTVSADCNALKQALTRVSILSNERYKSVRLQPQNGGLKINANNPEQEEAEEELDVEYQGETFEIGFNVTYLQDALGAIDTDTVRLNFTAPNSSCLIQPQDDENIKHVIMPMRL